MPKLTKEQRKQLDVLLSLLYDAERVRDINMQNQNGPHLNVFELHSEEELDTLYKDNENDELVELAEDVNNTYEFYSKAPLEYAGDVKKVVKDSIDRIWAYALDPHASKEENKKDSSS